MAWPVWDAPNNFVLQCKATYFSAAIPGIQRPSVAGSGVRTSASKSVLLNHAAWTPGHLACQAYFPIHSFNKEFEHLLGLRHCTVCLTLLLKGGCVSIL